MISHRLIRVLTLINLFFLSSISYAQEKISFSNESDVFISEIQNILLASPNKVIAEKSEKFMPALVERWNSGRFNKIEKDNIKYVCQKMADEKLTNDVLFLGFVYVINDLAFSSLDHESISNYLIYTQKLYDRSGKNALKEHVSFSRNFFEKEEINTVSNMKWYMRNAKMHIPSSEEFVVSAEKCTLVCASSRDSIVIENTKGEFSKNILIWNGDGGKTTWHRFKFDEEAVYAELSKYSINLKSVEYTADSVSFYNKNAYGKTLLGRLNDKTFANVTNNIKMPSFITYDDNCKISDMFHGISLNGYVGMQGREFCVSGSSDNRSEMKVASGDTLLARLYGKSFVINGDKLKCDDVVVSFYLGADSVSHNGLELLFDNKSREMVLFHPDNKTGFGPFFDTYHRINIYSEAIYWNVDSNEVNFNKLLSQNTDSKAYFQSVNYFKISDWNRLQGIDDYNPLTLMAMYLYDTKSDVVDVALFANYLNRNVEQVVSTVMRLVELGYVTYNADKKVAYPSESFWYAVKARNKDIDYDVIRIESFTQNRHPNMTLNLSNADLTVFGVNNVVVSEAKNVKIVPDNSKVIVKKNMNIEFSGVIIAGLFEFFSHESAFKYNEFAIDLPSIDSISFFVKNKKHQVIGEDDDYVRVKNVITNNSGIIYIDKNTNKSGVDDNANYPIFDCVSDSHVNFGDMSFILPPFRIDSLFSFSTSNFNLKGRLHSDIFPDFDEELLVMDDYSLGFNHQLGDDGMKILDGNATFNNIIHLSNDGFYGNGTLNFMTSFVESERMDFFKDSLVCSKARFEMLEVDDKKLSYPYALVESADVKIMVDDNQLIVTASDQPMTMYDNSTFIGVACLDSTGFTGKGRLDVDVARVKSDYFRFENTVFEADSSRFTIVADDYSDALLATNYRMTVDLVGRHGSFQYLDGKSQLTFPLNKFMCTLDKAEWKMDEQTISLSSDYVGRFISTETKQDSLSFTSSKANYNMNDYTIDAYDVDTVKVADATIVLSENMINIGKYADIKPVENAKVITDGSKHEFYDAEVKILGRHEYQASGFLDYTDHDGRVTPLKFNDIRTDSTGMTIASCTVGENDNFLVSKDYLFKGNVIVQPDSERMVFDGNFMMFHPCLNDYQWFNARFSLNPDSIVIPINKDMSEITSGMYYDTLNKEFFVTFLNKNLMYAPDKKVAEINGDLYYDAVNRCYRNSMMTLQTDSCFLIGESEMNLGFESSFIKFATDGRFIYDIYNDQLSVEAASSLKFLFDDKLMEMVAISLSSSVADSIKGVKIKDDRCFVFDGLKMKWINGMNCFMNESPLRLVSIKNHKMNITVNGHLLLNYNDGPSMSLYLECADGKWLFFKYADGVLISISSDNEYNNVLMGLKEKQCHFMNTKTGEEYEFAIGDFTDVNNFMMMMKYLKEK